jgi:hypothetical protein
MKELNYSYMPYKFIDYTKAPLLKTLTERFLSLDCALTKAQHLIWTFEQTKEQLIVPWNDMDAQQKSKLEEKEKIHHVSFLQILVFADTLAAAIEPALTAVSDIETKLDSYFKKTYCIFNQLEVEIAILNLAPTLALILKSQNTNVQLTGIRQAERRPGLEAILAAEYHSNITTINCIPKFQSTQLIESHRLLTACHETDS